jgi:hypothetical protein
MLQAYYFGLALLAGALTAAWLFRRERITVTAFLAAVSWVILAVYGGEVERASGCCGSTSAAAVGIEIRALLFGLGLLSVLVLILHQVGVYPPVTDQAYDGDTTETTNA